MHAVALFKCKTYLYIVLEYAKAYARANKFARLVYSWKSIQYPRIIKKLYYAEILGTEGGAGFNENAT